ncbi:hypothetical protein E2C01_040607 [Portunus trituberculatus]|uniref:Uncharacterized protein n=1 Tax=Portunus trituberculatus TaxID=210409 RepID=A0A5B7FPN7_PORTR|nr:hypothetical protein [Portunus trituberculatus]
MNTQVNTKKHRRTTSGLVNPSEAWFATIPAKVTVSPRHPCHATVPATCATPLPNTEDRKDTSQLSAKTRQEVPQS